VRLKEFAEKLTWHPARPDTEYDAGMVVKTPEGIFLVGDVVGFDPGEVQIVGCGRCRNIMVPTEYAFLDELFGE